MAHETLTREERETLVRIYRRVVRLHDWNLICREVTADGSLFLGPAAIVLPYNPNMYLSPIEVAINAAYREALESVSRESGLRVHQENEGERGLLFHVRPVS